MASKSENTLKKDGGSSLLDLVAPVDVGGRRRKSAPIKKKAQAIKPTKTTKPRKAAAKTTKPRKASNKAAARRAKPVAATEAAVNSGAFNPRAPEIFLNRELTWLNFNLRVLHEAWDKRTPLLERVKFLAIASSNLDEFFMKRIGGLKQQIGAGVHDLTVDGRTPQQQMDECARVIGEMRLGKRELYLNLIKELGRNGIEVIPYADLPAKERGKLRSHYLKNIYPLVTPLAMDPAHPFPFISNLSLNLLVTLHYPNEPSTLMARIKVPVGGDMPRFVAVGDGFRFVTLEDVIANNLDLLFPDMEISSCELFRVTRNSNTEIDEEQAGDLLEMIEAELRGRKFAPIVRMETEEGIIPVHRGMLAAELGLDEETDVFATDVMIGMGDLMELAMLDIPALHDPDHHPINNIKLQDNRNIFHIIRTSGPILLQHPYESFSTSVTRFVKEASRDPKVQAIKMVLYRTSADTNIIDHLIEAARNGKQVAVVVELKARFDEAANIQWASRLEEVGIHVTYGVLGLKTHSKLTLVVRRDYNGLRRYAHIGTGNYHAGTARIYSDLGLLTADDAIGGDLTQLFNYLTTGCKPLRDYDKILAAPKTMKKALLSKIDREATSHSVKSPGLIRLKTNALEDPDIVTALYRASQAGVTIQLVVRDTCRLRPGVPGLSDNITVVSIVGRFLEHCRIYHFRNGGDEEYYIGSADLMTRNLESRVEVIAPVEDAELRKEFDRILDAQIKDRRNAWDMLHDGSYAQRQTKPGRFAEGSQQILIAAAEKRHQDANRVRKRKLKITSRRKIK